MTIFDIYDVVELILNCDCISFVDICRLSSVSKTFYSASKSNKLWKKKYTQTWPELAALYDARFTDWYKEFRVRFDFKKLISNKLPELSAKFYHCENVSSEAFLYFSDIAQDHKLGYDIVVSELEDVIYDSHSHLNLTRKYYACKALRYMRQSQLKLQWEDYLSESSHRLTLVKGACLISQYCQPTVPKCTSNVSADIEDIAKHVFEKIKLFFPHHPVVVHGLLKEDMISSSLWTSGHCKEILYCISTVMFEDLQFCSNSADCYSAETTYIDKVLTARCGTSITLGIIYSAVAAKLGVSCLSVNFPGHFLLKWREYPSLVNEEAYSYIDVIDKGSFKRFNDLTDLAPGFQNFLTSWTEPVSPIKVFIRMAFYLVDCGQKNLMQEDDLAMCNALEVLCLLNPDDLEHKLLLARLFLSLDYNITEARCILQEIAASNPVSPLVDSYLYQSTWNTLEKRRISQPPIEAKLRDPSKGMKYAVGMIMRQKKYKHRCVIYGWYYTCVSMKDLKKRFLVNNYVYRDGQPYYYVLKENGREDCLAQEHLEIDQENRPIPHMGIGRYFESFHGSYYLPNKQTLAEYPEDIGARESASRTVATVM